MCFFHQVSPVGGLHYNGELHPIPTPQDGLAVSIPVVIKYEHKFVLLVTVQHLEQVKMSNFQVKILDAMQDIYYGRVASPWALDVDDWSIDPHQVIFDLHQILHEF